MNEYWERIRQLLKIVQNTSIHINSKNIEKFKDYDLIIHIGSPKSGTSALQNFFLKNHSILLKKGVYYPEHGLDKNGISGGHSALAIALIENRINDALGLFDSWYLAANKLNKTLLLSSESFFNLSKKLEPLLRNKKVLVIAYHRNIIEYLLSVHNQLIKRHFATQNFKMYTESILSNTKKSSNLVNKSFSVIYQEWEALVGKENLIVRSYQTESFIEGKIEKDFLNRIGLEYSDFKIKNKKINISYTSDALETKRMINFVLYKDSALNHKIDLALQEYSEKQSTHTLVSDNSLDNELYSRLKSHFDKDEKFVQEKYLENFTNVEKNTRGQINNTKNKNIDSKSLQKVIDYLRKNNEINNYLLNATLEKLKLGFANYSIFKLAELLNIKSLEDYETNNFWFNEQQLKKIGEGQYKEIDFLRDIANILTQRKNYIDAEKIVQQALKIRPNGPAIIRLNEKIQKSLTQSNLTLQNTVNRKIK